MSHNKIFWWGEPRLGEQTPPLYILDATTAINPATEYGAHSGRVTQLLSEGYVEISTRSAHSIGMPI